MSILITQKHRMASEANLRPCRECLKKNPIVVMTEIRCDNMLERPYGKARRFIRCTNGICKAHDTSLTIMNKEIEHCCSDCFVAEMRKSMRGA